MPGRIYGCVVGVAFLLGCAGNAAGPGAAGSRKPPLPTEVDRYMPLVDDTVFAYDTSDDMGQTGLLVMQITRPRDGRADLKLGEKIQRLELVPDGIRHVAGGYLLRAPLEIGASWKNGMSRVRVTKVGEGIQVKAGKFANCIETLEESTGKKVVSTYCPDVGLVLLVVEGMSGNEYGSVRAELRSHGPRVDLGAPSE